MISFVAVALSGYISALVIGLFAVGVVISWISNFGEREQPTWLWNSIVLGVLALFVIDGIVSGDWLLAAINFTCFILLGKLFNRRTAKDTFQIYLLSFLLFIASGVLNPGLSYAVVFPIYIVVLTLALLSLHLRHDLTDLREKSERIHGPDIALRHEEALLARGRLFRGRLFVGTAVLAIAAFLSSMVIFYLFPRLGFGFFVGKKRPGMSVAGFSDNVRLGSFGRIRNNYQVVMRVELPDEKGPRRLRLRGMSFDTYTGRGWVKGTRRRWQPRSVTRSGETLYLVGLRTSYDHRVQIYQEPLSSQVVFGEPKVVRVAVRDFREGMRDPNAPKILRDRSGDLFYKSPDSVAVSYTAYSDTIVPSVAELRKSKGVLPRTIVSRYTALPHMDGRIRQLAMAIVRGKETVYDRVVAIERHLKYNYRYSLRGGHDFRQPLVDFLFNKRYGHCEFFSTTMAVMLRQIGVPSRVVTGFYGGVWNRFGRYMAIRQNDAHAWVEVYFPGPGWVTFDPTPTGELLVPDESGTLGFMKSWLDALQLRWFKWVIEYDLQRQIR
ncbi:MAG: DUF3488 domain-containing protein, partial [Myxococcales bacterium]|nr:DUF3488 domain-containing protein [Myxococcales bacterium]